MDRQPRTQLSLTQVIDVDGQAYLTVRGEIDAATADQFGAAVLNALHEPQVRALVLDFHCLEFIDSIGINALIGGWRVAHRGGRGLPVPQTSAGGGAPRAPP